MDIEKQLGIEPLKKETITEPKGLSCLMEHINQFPDNPIPDKTGTIVPNDMFDYLFIDWPAKPKAEPYKINNSNRLEKQAKQEPKEEKKKNEEDLSPEEKDVLKKWKDLFAMNLARSGSLVRMEGHERSMNHLAKKGWQKWNNADWRLAKRHISKVLPKGTVAVATVEKKEYPSLFSFPILSLAEKSQMESIKRSSNKALVEMKFLDFLFKKAMTAGHPETEKEEGKEKIFKRIEDIVSKTLREFDIKTSSHKKYDDADVMGIDYKIIIGKQHYALHTYLLKNTKVFMCSIWDKEENRLLLNLSEGYLRQYYYLVGIGKERLRSWIGSQHGKS